LLIRLPPLVALTDFDGINGAAHEHRVVSTSPLTSHAAQPGFISLDVFSKVSADPILVGTRDVEIGSPYM
jgi:hypothetical protein